MDDVSGVLLRPLIEVVLASLYGLHGGPEAHRRLCDALVRDLRKLPEGDDLAPALEAFADWEGPADRVNWEALSDELDRIFQAQGRNEQLMFKNLYESAYRGESMVNVHGSLAGLGGHLIDGADWFGVRPGQGGQWSQR